MSNVENIIKLIESNFSKWIASKTYSGEVVLDKFKEHCDYCIKDYNAEEDKETVNEILKQCKIDSWDKLSESFSNFSNWLSNYPLEPEDVGWYSESWIVPLKGFDGTFDHHISDDDGGEIDEVLEIEAAKEYKSSGKLPKMLYFSHNSWFIGDTYRLEVLCDHSLSKIIGWNFVTD